MLIAISNGSLVLIVTLVVAAIVVATIVLRRRREHIWSGIARQLGLQFTLQEGQPCVSGLLDDRRFILSTIPDSSDTGPLGVEVVRASLTLRHTVPGGLTLESADDLLGDAQRLIDEQQLQTGDGRFDHSVTAHATDVESALEWLTTERRSAIRKLIRDRVSGDVKLVDNELQWTCRESVSNESALVRQISLMRQTASILEVE